jgi:hypothetical protein
MFRSRRRPKGLEFASCLQCNRGTRLTDLVAAMLCRTYPNSEGILEKEELQSILKAVGNNVPGLLQEMRIGHAGQKIARKRLPPGTSDGGFLRVNGPIASGHMETFAAKLGFALFYEVTRKIIPPTGGVAALWYSNVDRLEGTFPQSIFDLLLPPQTLKQGRFDVAEQFSYQWRLTEGEQMGLFCAFFGASFAILACAATDTALLRFDGLDQADIAKPGDLIKRLQV